MGAGIAKESLTNLTDHIPNLGAFHCAMIGLDSAGKTTVLYRLKFNQYMNTAPTIGFNCEKVRFHGSSFTLWDVGGQDKLRPLWRSYTRCTDGIIFVVDSCKEDRLEEAKLELLKIYKSCSERKAMSKHSHGNIPVLILANKQDLPMALDVNKLEHLLGLKQLGKECWHIQPTCAITGDGLDEGMTKLVEMISERGGKRKISKNVLNSSGSSSALNNNNLKKSHSSTKVFRKVQRSHSHHY